MPTSVTARPPVAARSRVASTRILRLAFGTTLSLFISQAIGWDLSFVAPIITMTLLAMPLSRPPARFFLIVIVAICASVYGAFIFLPMLLHQELAGLLLVGLALFHSFYFTARGGTAAIGTLTTIALAMTVAVGTVSVDALLAVAAGLVKGTLAGTLVAMLSHAVIADPPRDDESAGRPAPDSPSPDPAIARGDALRSLAVVAPILLWFLMSGSSAGNMAVLIKVASMGQEVSIGNTRNAAKSLLVSTFFGGLAAIVAWQVLSIWPSLLIYVLLIAIAGLIFGQRIFDGAGLRANSETWSYAYLTMIVVLAPAVLDGNYGSSADARFYDRLLMFVWATIYGIGAVYVFDAFWPRGKSARGS